MNTKKIEIFTLIVELTLINIYRGSSEKGTNVEYTLAHDEIRAIVKLCRLPFVEATVVEFTGNHYEVAHLVRDYRGIANAVLI